ncbi:MAG TPA: DUF6600 domain-containing protein, partial [Myxococcaceae bacterium]|nr:DUF6600 domain-containing protein [Myxococcaceae bacterium]
MYSLFRSLPRSAVLSLALLNPWGSPQAFAQDDGWSSDPDTFEGSEAEGPPPESESGWTAEAPPPVADGPEAYPADAFGPGASLAEANSPGPPPTPQNFEAALNPHGTWIQVSGLGRVWQPAPAVVGGDFVPYVTGGSWVYTQAGWTFHSQWDWGWAPFHYGRWHLAAGYGWVWWPNTTWAPAWVEWRRGGSYVGWAPLPPPGYALSFSVGATGWSFTSYRAFGRPWSARHARAPVWYRGVPWGGDRG